MTLWRDKLPFLRRVGLDTNALIYFTQRVDPYAPLVADVITLMDQGRLVGVISVVVEMELLVRPLRQRDQASLERLELFLQESQNLLVRPLDRLVARRAAEVRARTRLSVPDAVIVATALEEHCDAIIGNDTQMASATTSIPYLYLEDYVS